MPHAIIRGQNGRRHEVDFADAPIRVEIFSSEETVEILVEADSRRCLKSVVASPFSTCRATGSAKRPPQRRDVARNPLVHPRRDRRFRDIR